jgi:DNA repair protein RadD
LFSLRDYQQTGVDDIRNAYREGYRAPLYVLPTGGGKTVVFTYVTQSAISRGKNVLILVHRDELLRQSISKLQGFGIASGAISPKYTPNFTASCQVGMVQTVVNRTKYYPNVDFIIVDEAHHIAANTYMQILQAYPKAYVLGVTATPVRSDGKGLGKGFGGIFDTMILGPTVQDLIDRGFLVEPIIYTSNQQLDFSGLNRGKSGDFTRPGMEKIMDKPAIIGNAVDHYRSICAYEPGVAFCVSRKAAEHTASEFRAMGFKSFSVDGTTDHGDRKRILNGLSDGSVNVVTSCDVISEGTDIPAIAVAMLLRPTASEGLYLQQVGRALRPAPGKSNAIVLDHVGNVLRHGLPEETRAWSLQGSKKSTRQKDPEEQAESVHQCENCFRVYHARLKKCPGCGFERQIQQRELEQLEGELVQLSKEEIKAISRKKRDEVAGAQTVEDLQRIARQRGYNPRWVKHMMNARKKKKEQKKQTTGDVHWKKFNFPNS